MIRWAVIFLGIAIVAAIFGFTGFSEKTAFFAKIVFFVFTVLFASNFVLGKSLLRIRKGGRHPYADRKYK